MRASIRTADDSTVRFLDGLIVFWSVLWLVVGSWSGYMIWELSSLGDTITRSGLALDSTGQALQAIGAVPVVGERPGELGDEVVATAEDIAARGQEIRSRLRQLSLTLGLSIILMPTTPVLGLYLPLRLARRQDVREMRTALDRHGLDSALERYLAERAMHHLPYATVRQISEDPWQDISDGRAGTLARAELARIGLQAPDRS